MRNSNLFRGSMVALSAGLLATFFGIGCIDVFQQPRSDADFITPSEQASRLGVTVRSPSVDASVPAGTDVSIGWSASNRTGETGTASVLVEDLDTLTRTTIADGLSVTGSTGQVSTTWDTAGFDAGTYRIRVRVEAGALSREATAVGRITIDSAPTFAFTRPTSNQTLPDADPLEIAWSGIDPESDARVDLFVDPDSTDSTDNRIEILSNRLLNDSADDDEQTFDWNGRSTSNERVDAGTYSLIAVVDDEVNDPLTVVLGFTITVPEEEDNTAVLRFTAPEEDTTFLTTDADLPISMNVNQGTDALLDISVDTDDNHANGNEIRILSQRFIESDTDTTDFNWNGDDAGGNSVPDGIYRLFFISSTGTGTPTVDDGDFLVFRRSDSEQPLIGLLTPNSVVTFSPGQFLTVSWRDDDPTDAATITIVLDDDNMPRQLVETDEPELEILTGRSAMPDEVQDTFQFQIPSSLQPGTYYIFAYIDATPATAAPDHVNIGPAPIRIEDPANPS